MPPTPPDAAHLYQTHIGFVRKWAAIYQHQYRLDEDDLLSEAGLLLLRCLPKYDPRRPFLPWFKRHLLMGFLQLARARARRNARLPKQEFDVDLELIAEDAGDLVITEDTDKPAVAHPDGQRVIDETLRMSKAWLARDPYRVRAEVGRRIRVKSKWGRRRLDAAVAAVTAHINRRAGCRS